MAAAAAAAILASGTERDLQLIVEGQAKAIGFLFRQNNFEQQAAIRETDLELIKKNDEERRATHEEFDKKINEVKTAVITVNEAQTQADASRKSQEDLIRQEFEKGHKYLDGFGRHGPQNELAQHGLGREHRALADRAQGTLSAQLVPLRLAGGPGQR